MALILHQSGNQPLGQFDGLDTELTSFKGGEVCTLTSTTLQGSDLASADVQNDGYTGTVNKVRPAVSLTLSSISKPLFLADDGTLNYGTLFGTVVGSSAGQTSYGFGQTPASGAVLGPHTALGSGKITLWDKPGLYGVTLDACDAATDGLVPGNTSMTIGKALVYTTKGLLTPQGSTNAVGGASIVARFVEFETFGSVVTTPQTLVAALNSPSGNVSALQTLRFYQAVFWYAGAGGNA